MIYMHLLTFLLHMWLCFKIKYFIKYFENRCWLRRVWFPGICVYELNNLCDRPTFLVVCWPSIYGCLHLSWSKRNLSSLGCSKPSLPFMSLYLPSWDPSRSFLMPFMFNIFNQLPNTAIFSAALLFCKARKQAR